ncbi:SLOG family protein [Alicyclobacillus shizuokensis]|uniref:SLOG family protein n=1 Tax=Alicyclobacillus shizuokensis TaxID=392014 RepID=UPI000832C106|nr:SLOG family protein [Alicyclobacillus shizuokensis]
MPIYAFTGHRPGRLGGYKDNPIRRSVIQFLRQMIHRVVYKYKTVGFVTGGALGVDTWAADLVLEAKRRAEGHGKYNIHLVLCLPSTDHGRNWREEDRRKLHAHMQSADFVNFVTQGPYDGPECLMRRNRYMVDRSDGLIAVWDGTPSGTGMIVSYAKERGVPVIAFHPNEKRIFVP